MLIGLKHRGKRFEISVKKCSELQKATGLMFCRRANAETLLFEFPNMTKTTIHSFFVFFPFIAIWLDKNNKVIEIKKINPWKLSIKPKKPFVRLVEIPINQKNRKIVGLLVDDAKGLKTRLNYI